MRYGGLRDLVLAATIALGDGRVIRAGRPVVKNVAGYDLPKVFVGAHGTLGLIADVTLKLALLPRVRTSLIAPLDDLERGLACGARLLRVCLNASALLLVRPTTGGFEWSSVVDGRRMALVYTAEGSPEDVAAELAEAHEVLKAEGMGEVTQVEEPSGSEVWAGWLANEWAASDGSILRAGVAAKHLPALLRALADGGTGSFVADLAGGLLYVCGVGEVAPLRRAALSMGGYAIVLPTSGAASGAQDSWGYTPGSLELMRTLRQRWGAGGLLNPGAFLV